MTIGEGTYDTILVYVNLTSGWKIGTYENRY